MEISDLIFNICELVGTAAFAVSGAMAAINKRVDIFGVLFLGIITALGGGITRDIIIGQLPPRMFTSYTYVALAALASLAVFIVASVYKDGFIRSEPRIDRVNNVFDALGLGAFTVTGVRVGIDAGYMENVFMIVFLGMITGVGGGLLRDLMIDEIPFVLKKRVYAVASIMGGIVYWLCIRLRAGELCAMIAGIAVVFLIRMLATTFKWNLPKAF